MTSDMDAQRILARGERQANVLPRLLRSLLQRLETPLLLTDVLPPAPSPANDDAPSRPAS